ncbi:MAG: hypothetical protein WA705_28290 [Candidatus Ozemobacteraceae bacterium]
MSFEIKEQLDVKTAILRLEGYFSQDAGKVLHEHVEKLLRQKRMFFVIDFSNCPSINSPGAAALLDTTMLIVEDFRGAVVLSGLKPLAASLLSMVGVIPPAVTAGNVEDALKILPNSKV